MNARLETLQPYPFEKLATLLRGVSLTDQVRPINLSIGEPSHETPSVILHALAQSLAGLSRYPTTKGGAALREAIAEWLVRRFALPIGSIDPERQVLPVAGTREALFSFAQCVVDSGKQPLVAMPNPFYQIYEGAALLAGAQPHFINGVAETGFLPSFDEVPESVWSRCALLYICTPGNPSGSVIPVETLQRLIDLAERYDFIIASDECYSELYRDEAAPPVGLLQAAMAMGNDTFERCVVFHSLSKRSSVPGLRSGFVAGDAAVLSRYLLYRTYHGCAMSLPVQAASVAAWGDEEHVRANRALYRAKFEAVVPILSTVLDVDNPAAGFYLWPRTPYREAEFAKRLYAQHNVTVLPGSFLSREAHGVNPGDHHVRIALVASLDDCIEAAQRIAQFLA